MLYTATLRTRVQQSHVWECLPSCVGVGYRRTMPSFYMRRAWAMVPEISRGTWLAVCLPARDIYMHGGGLGRLQARRVWRGMGCARVYETDG